MKHLAGYCQRFGNQPTLFYLTSKPPIKPKFSSSWALSLGSLRSYALIESVLSLKSMRPSISRSVSHVAICYTNDICWKFHVGLLLLKRSSIIASFLRSRSIQRFCSYRIIASWYLFPHEATTNLIYNMRALWTYGTTSWPLGVK